MLELQPLETWSATSKAATPAEKIKGYSDYLQASYFKAGALDDEVYGGIKAGAKDYAQANGLLDPELPEEEQDKQINNLIGAKTDVEKDARFLLQHYDLDFDQSKPEAAEQKANADTLRKYFAMKQANPAGLPAIEPLVAELVGNADEVRNARIAALDRKDTPLVAVTDADGRRQVYPGADATPEYIRENLDSLLSTGVIDAGDLNEVRTLISPINGGKATVAEEVKGRTFAGAMKDLTSKDPELKSALDETVTRLRRRQELEGKSGGELAVDAALTVAGFVTAVPFEIGKQVLGTEDKFFEQKPEKDIIEILANNEALLNKGYTEQDIRRYAADVVQDFAGPAYRADKPESGIGQDSRGNMIIAPALVMNKALYEQAAQAADLNEEQRKRADSNRASFLTQLAPDAKRLIVENDDEAAAEYAAAKGRGETDEQFVENWIATKGDKYSGFTERVQQFGNTIGRIVSELPLGLAVLSGSETATKALQSIGKDANDRREYARLMGDEFGLIFQIGDAVPQLASQILTTIGSGALYTGLKSVAKAGARKVVGTAAKNALSLVDDATAAAVKSSAKIGGEAAMSTALKTLGDKVGPALKMADESLPLFATTFYQGATSTYVSLYSQLPETMSHEDKHRNALGYAIGSGLSTAALTVGMGFLGRGGAEDLATKVFRPLQATDEVAAGARAIPLDKLTYKQAKLAHEALNNSGVGITDVAFKKVLRNNLGDAYKNYLRNAYNGAIDEGVEEAIDTAISIKIEDAALKKDTSLIETANQLWHAFVIGGALGGGVKGITELAAPMRFSERVQALQTAVDTSQRISQTLRDSGSAATAAVFERNVELQVAALIEGKKAEIAVQDETQQRRDTELTEFTEDGQALFELEDETETSSEKGLIVGDLIGERVNAGAFQGVLQRNSDGSFSLKLDKPINGSTTVSLAATAFQPLSKTNITRRTVLPTLGMAQGNVAAGTPYVLVNKARVALPTRKPEREQEGFLASPQEGFEFSKAGDNEVLTIRGSRIVGTDDTIDLQITDQSQINNIVKYYGLQRPTEAAPDAQFELPLFDLAAQAGLRYRTQADVAAAQREDFETDSMEVEFRGQLVTLGELRDRLEEAQSFIDEGLGGPKVDELIAEINAAFETAGLKEQSEAEAAFTEAQESIRVGDLQQQQEAEALFADRQEIDDALALLPKGQLINLFRKYTAKAGPQTAGKLLDYAVKNPEKATQQMAALEESLVKLNTYADGLSVEKAKVRKAIRQTVAGFESALEGIGDISTIPLTVAAPKPKAITPEPEPDSELVTLQKESESLLDPDVTVDNKQIKLSVIQKAYANLEQNIAGLEAMGRQTQKPLAQLKALGDLIQTAKQTAAARIFELDAQISVLQNPLQLSDSELKIKAEAIKNGSKPPTERQSSGKTKATKPTTGAPLALGDMKFRTSGELRKVEDAIANGYLISNLAGDLGFSPTAVGKDSVTLFSQDTKIESYSLKVKRYIYTKVQELYPFVNVPAGTPTRQSKVDFTPMDSEARRATLTLPVILGEDGKAAIAGVFTNDPRITAAQIDYGLAVVVPDNFTEKLNPSIQAPNGRVTSVSLSDKLIVAQAGALSTKGTTSYNPISLKKEEYQVSMLQDPASNFLPNTAGNKKLTFKDYLLQLNYYGNSELANTIFKFSFLDEDERAAAVASASINYALNLKRSALAEQLRQSAAPTVSEPTFVEDPKRDAFIDKVRSSSDNLMNPAILKSLTKKALAAGYITDNDATEILRTQKDLGSKDDTTDAFVELVISLEYAYTRPTETGTTVVVDLTEEQIADIVRGQLRNPETGNSSELTADEIAKLFKANAGIEGAYTNEILAKYGRQLLEQYPTNVEPNFFDALRKSVGRSKENKRAENAWKRQLATTSIDEPINENDPSGNPAIVITSPDDVFTQVADYQDSLVEALKMVLARQPQIAQKLADAIGIATKTELPAMDSVELIDLANLTLKGGSSDAVRFRKLLREDKDFAIGFLREGFLTTGGPTGQLLTPAETKAALGAEKSAALRTQAIAATTVEEQKSALRAANKARHAAKFSRSDDNVQLTGAARSANSSELNRLGIVSGDPESVLNALRKLAKTGDPNTRMIAELLSSFPDLIRNTSFVIGDFDDVRFAGAYMPKSNLVVLNLSGHNGRGVVDVLLHEYIHAATTTLLFNPTTAAQRAAVKRIEQLRKLVKARLDALGYNNKQWDDALGANDEFLTYALTDTKFQALVKLATPPKQRSLFTRLVESMLEFFGINKGDPRIDTIEELLSFTNMLGSDTTFQISTRSMIRNEAREVADGMAELREFLRVTQDLMSPLRAGDEQVRLAQLSQLDTEYLAAVDAGDMATAQRLVDEAAAVAGYTEKGNRAGVYNKGIPLLPSTTGGLGSAYYAILGGDLSEIQQFAGEVDYRFRDNPDYKMMVGGVRVNLGSKPLFVKHPNDVSKWARDNGLMPAFEAWLEYQYAVNSAYETIYTGRPREDWNAGSRRIDVDPNSLEARRAGRLYLRTAESKKEYRDARILEGYTDAQIKAEGLDLDTVETKDAGKLNSFLFDQGHVTAVVVDWARAAKIGRASGDGRMFTEVAVANPNQIKSAEPVTRDSNGNVIPLSQRFDPTSEDIRFSLGRTATEGELAIDPVSEFRNQVPADIELVLSEDLRGEATVLRSRPNTIFVNPTLLANRVTGLNARGAQAAIKSLVDHELGHMAINEAFTNNDLERVATELGADRLQQIALDYYGATGLSGAEINAQIEADRANGTLNDSMLADEWLRMQATKAAIGRTFEQDFDYALSDPSLFDSLLRAIDAFVTRLRNRFSAAPTTETAAGISRAERTLRKLKERGPNRRAEAPVREASFGDLNLLLQAIEGSPDGDRASYSLAYMSSAEGKVERSDTAIADKLKLYNLPSQLRDIITDRTQAINSAALSTKSFVKKFPKLRDRALAGGVAIEDIRLLFGTTAPDLSAADQRDIELAIKRFSAALAPELSKDARTEAIERKQEALQATKRNKFRTEFRKRQQAAELKVRAQGFSDLVDQAVALRKDINRARAGGGIGFDESDDIYLTRTYRFFTTTGWSLAAKYGGSIKIDGKDVDFHKLRKTAAKLFAEQADAYLAKIGKPYTRKDVDARTVELLDQYLETLEKVHSSVDKTVVDSLRKDLDRFKPKKDVDGALRSLLGEIEDPLANAVNTLHHVSMLSANENFRKSFADAAIATGFASRTPVSDWRPVYPASTEATMGPLAGLYMEPKAAAAFLEAYGGSPFAQQSNSTSMVNAAGKVLSRVSGAVVFGATKLGFGYWPRNSIGGILLNAAQGILWNPFTKATRTSLKQAWDTAYGRLPTDEEKRNAMLRLTELGVLNDTALGRETLDLTRGLLTSDEQVLTDMMADIEEARLTGEAGGIIARMKQKPATKAVLDLLGKAYSTPVEILTALDAAIDGAAKANAYYFELNAIEQHFGDGKTTEEKEVMAAKKIKLTFPSHSQRYDLVKAFGRSSAAMLVVPFIGWKSEMFRTMSNTPRLAMQEIREGGSMAVRGWRRLLGFTGTLSIGGSAVGGAITALFQSLTDDEEEEDRKLTPEELASLREALPLWQRGHTLHSRLLKNGKVQFVDMSSLMPHSLLTDMGQIIYDSIQTGEGIGTSRLASYVATQLLGTQIAATAVFEAANNEDDFGNPIYVETDTAPVKMGRMFDHLVKSALKPAGFKFYEKVTREGNQQKQEQLLGEIFGGKLTTLDNAEIQRRGFRGLKALQDSAHSTISELTSGRFMDQEQVNDIVNRHQDAVNESQRRLSRFMSSMLDMGSNPDAVMSNASSYRFSKNTIESGMQGYRIPWVGNDKWDETVYRNVLSGKEQDPVERIMMIRQAQSTKPDVYWVRED
jgi:hypothetical protein